MPGLAIPPGDHLFVVSGGPGAYRLLLEPMPLPPGLGKLPELEHEPNGGGSFTDRLRFGGARAGLISSPTDGDVYRFYVPTSTAATLALTSVNGPVQIRLLLDGAGPVESWDVAPEAPVAFRAALDPGDYTLDVRPGRGTGAGAAYVIGLDHGDPYASADGAATGGATVAVKLVEDTAAAYVLTQQTLRGELTLSAKGAGTYTLEARSTDPQWVPRLSKTTVTLAAGQRATVPFEVQVAPDARADRPVRIDVGAQLSGGAWSSGHAIGSAQPLAPPVRPAVVWELPDALLGGVNVAPPPAVG